jgi:hypothetical protein
LFQPKGKLFICFAQTEFRISVEPFPGALVPTSRSRPPLHGGDRRGAVEEPAHLSREEDRAHQLVQGILREERPPRHSQVDGSN